MQLSVVIPVHNEVENIGSLLAEVDAALARACNYEVIVVDDGSTDDTHRVLNELREHFPRLRVVHHRNRCGQSMALISGILAAVAPCIATLDGDGQNDPHDLPGMLRQIEDAAEEDRLWMVAGFRKMRRDSRWRVLCSRVANGVRSRILKDQTPDSGCGIKVFLREAFLRMPHFNHMHRFLPSLIQRGGGRVISVPVNHRPRVFGKSHYGTAGRLLAGILDLAGVAWLIRRNQIPVIDQQDAADDHRTNLDCIRIDGTADVHSPFRRAVA
jgi:dolichol-phosphate mannosyltransferase